MMVDRRETRRRREEEMSLLSMILTTIRELDSYFGGIRR